MWSLFTVRFQFEGRLCGSVPLSHEYIRPWLASRAPAKKPPEGPSLDELEEEVRASTEEAEERFTVGFHGDERGLYMRQDTVKAHVKDCSQQIKNTIEPPIRNLRSKVANACFVKPNEIYIMRDGRHVTAPDGDYERPVHAMTAAGPRNALKRVQFIERPTLEFTLRVLRKTEVTLAVLTAIFEYGGIHGYAGERSMGEGQYVAEITPAA